MNENMKPKIEFLLEVIKSDYSEFMSRSRSTIEGSEKIAKQMIEEFNEGLTVKEGNKYIKIIEGRRVWGFIVNVDNDKKFRRGDILKPAGWATPARNKPRGNICDGDYSWVRWTGPAYL